MRLMDSVLKSDFEWQICAVDFVGFSPYTTFVSVARFRYKLK